MSALKIGIAGLGTVGAHVFKILNENKFLIEKRCGRSLKIVAVSSRDRTKDRGIDTSNVAWYEDAMDVAADENVDIVIETIGGSEGVAYELSLATLRAGKQLVTANKALIAHHGAELIRLVENHGGNLAFEAAVAGGVPTIKGIREGLAANEISAVYGILNGTCNYILSEMRETGRDFAEVLEEAQALGYAEADPSFDIDGIDTGHKLSILASLAFEALPKFEAVTISGIREITLLDIVAADELGYRIKLLGITRRTETEQIEQSVEPCLVPISAPIASIDGSLNAVYVEGDFVGQSLMVGHGAGGGPTASAVVADIIDIARNHDITPLGVRHSDMAKLPVGDLSGRRGRYYLRLMVTDQPGVIADATRILCDCDVSMQSVLQHSEDPGQTVPVIMTTHDAVESSVHKAIEKIAQLDAIQEKPYLMRIESFGG